MTTPHPLLNTTQQKLVEHQTILKLFPTPVFKLKVNDPVYLKSLAKEVLNLKANEQGYQGIDLWCTYDNLHEHPAFKKLADIIMTEMSNVFDNIGISRTGHYITGMWSNVAKMGYSHSYHNHPNSFYSGVLYLQLPKGAGKLFFADPRPVNAIVPEYDNPNPELVSGNFEIDPEEGIMFIFPSWFPHGVLSTRESPGAVDRISLSFNVMLNADIKMHTAKWKI